MKPSFSRRKLIANSLKAGLIFPFLSYQMLSCTTKSEEQATNKKPKIKPLKILILGGTSFLGPHQVAYALSRGHSVATFTRGKTKPTIHTELFSQVEALIGDRENDLTALENRQWDVVIDNSGRKVAWTKKTAALLKDKAHLYVYTSSTGVYFPYLGDDIKEATILLTEEPAGIEDEVLKMEYGYGVMKTNSEIETVKAFGADRSIIVRPTYMMGPGDKTDRFIHWPVRLAKGGEVLVPGKTADPVQYIDVRDVAEWMIRLAEEKATGTYNAVGPKTAQTIHEFAEAAQQAFDIESTLIPIEDYNFLKANGIPYLVPWIMPDEYTYGSARVNNDKAIKAGLTFRNLRDSIQDIHQWWYSDALTAERRDTFEQKPNGLLLREAEIIKKWRAFRG